MKVCPYCAGDIQDEAVVCRYCHSDLPPFRATSGRRRCPYCAESIASSLSTCNHCQREISLDPGAGFFEPSSEPEFEGAGHEPEPDAVSATPAPPPPSQPTSLKDILSSLDAHSGSTDEESTPPEPEELAGIEPGILRLEAGWESHKTPPFALTPSEEPSFSIGDLAEDDEGTSGAAPDAWQDEQMAAPDLDSGSWHPEELGASPAEEESFDEDRQTPSSRDSAIFHRQLDPRSSTDSGVWRRSQQAESSHDSGGWKRGDDSGIRDSGSLRPSYAPTAGQAGSRSINYISQSSLRRSAINERLAELDSASRGERPATRAQAEPAQIHPGAFIVVAVAILSIALIYFLGPGRNALAFMLSASTPEVSTPIVAATPTSLPTALQPLIKDTSVPTATAPSAAAGCLNWDQVTEDDVGKELCVKGTVKRWFATQSFPMVVIFSEEPATFIFVDPQEAPSFVKPGTCISATGQVEIMGGERPYIAFVEPPTICDPAE